jgi:GT2 family glycosyltransferase
VLLRRGRQPLGWTTVDVLEAGRLDLAPLAEDVPARVIAKPSAPRRLAGPASGRFTAVCTTCAAADDAVRCVRMLRERGGPDLEIIVVENRPQRSSVQAALCTAFPNDPRLRYLEEARPGLSHARNAGLHAATGDYVAFIDDDVTVDENWLDSLQAAVANAPDAACITGPIFPSELETEAQVVLEHFATFSKGLDRRRYSLAGPDTAPLFPYAAGHFGSGANMTFRADALRRAGGFDVKLGTGTRARGGEDLDICVRLIQAGEALVYEPGVIVWHRHPDGIKRVRAQAHAYGVGLGAMLAKHLLFGPSRFELLKLMPHGARYLLSPGSRKNAAKRAGYPASLNLAERAGLLIGPLAYVASRLSSDDPPAAPAAESQPPAAPRAGCRRLWSGEFEWTAPVLPEPPLLTSGGEPFDHARLLIRVHGEPVGFVQVPIEQGYLQPAAVTAAARRAYAGRIDRHLAALDAIAAPSVAQPRWQPTVSIVVCTRDRPEGLRRCLAALSQLEYEHREVIVVDNAPVGGPTAALVAEAAAGDPRVRYVREPRPGLSRARNKGLREARGELIAFTDDDVRVDAMWLAGILRGFGRGSDVACVTGLVASASLEQASERFFDERVSWASSCEARVYGRDDGDQGSKLYPYAAGMFGTGANMALRTRVARALGGFDECLGAGSPTSGGEDLDMFVRVLRSGHALSYEPAALVWHDHRVRAQDLERQMYGYGKGLAAFLCKYLFSRSSGPDVARRAAHGASHFVGLGRRSEAASAREGLGVSLRRAELRGVLAGPPAYLRARRRANRQHLRAVAPR